MSSSKKKKERRRLRYERNVKKEIDHKKQAWEGGKLIEENHNQGPYSPEYTLALSERLYQYVGQERNKAQKVFNGELEITDKREGRLLSPDEVYVRGFRKYKMKIQDMILHWNPSVPKNMFYEFLKKTLEVYWDDVIEKHDFSTLGNVPYKES